MKARKKPVEIEFAHVRDIVRCAQGKWADIPMWVREAYDAGKIIILRDGLLVSTLEGQMRADADDVLIQGVKGELYPCKPNIFAETYEVIPG